LFTYLLKNYVEDAEENQIGEKYIYYRLLAHGEPVTQLSKNQQTNI